MRTFFTLRYMILLQVFHGQCCWHRRQYIVGVVDAREQLESLTRAIKTKFMNISEKFCKNWKWSQSNTHGPGGERLVKKSKVENLLSDSYACIMEIYTVYWTACTLHRGQGEKYSWKTLGWKSCVRLPLLCFRGNMCRFLKVHILNFNVHCTAQKIFLRKGCMYLSFKEPQIYMYCIWLCVCISSWMPVRLGV